MEKMLLKTEKDLKSAFSFFGKKYKKDIEEEVKKYPCVLIASYSEDIEFGSGYTFTIVSDEDFKKQNGLTYYF